MGRRAILRPYGKETEDEHRMAEKGRHGVDGSEERLLAWMGSVDKFGVQGPEHSSFGNCKECGVGH
jgi:hypothetical protein